MRSTSEFCARPFTVGEILVKPTLHEVVVGGEVFHLEPKVMGVLIYLAERSLEVVSRGELVAEVWEGAFVSDETLTMAVSKLRRALGDNPKSPRIVATIPKRGYRLLIPAEVQEGAKNPSADSSPLVARDRLHLELWTGWLALGLCVLLLAGLAMRFERGGEPAQSSWPQLVERSVPAPETEPLRVRRLTSLPGREMYPALSPDGRSVVFVAVPKSGGASDLYLQPVDGDSAIRLTEDTAKELHPAWSPDGLEIVYGQISDGDCHILRRGAWGGVAKWMADCGASAEPELAWAPNGKWLAWPERPGENRGVGIVLLEIDTGSKSFLTRPERKIQEDSRPAFSPDSRHLAFERKLVGGRGDLWVIPTAGGEERQITSDLDHLWGHTWTRDGDELIFSSLLGESFDLFRVGVDGARPPRWLPIPEGHISRDPSAARDAGGLVFEAWTYETNIWSARIDSETSTTQRLITSTAWDSSPVFSPDGNQVAFLSNRSGVGGVWITAADGSGANRVATQARYFESVPRWSPAGDRLVFVGGVAESTDLRIVDVGTARLQRLGAATKNGRAPAWSADGRSIYFASLQDGDWQVWKLGLESGKLEQMTEMGGFAAQESPDGLWLYFTRPGQSGLWRQPVDGGSARMIFGDLAREAWGNWILTGESLVFARSVGVDTAISVFDLVSQQEEQLGMVPGPILNPGLAWDEEHRRILFARLEGGESDLQWVSLSSEGD